MADVLPLRPRVAAPPADISAGPLAVDAKGLTARLPAELRTIRTWGAAGKLPKPVRIGGRVVRLVAEIRAWLDAGAPDRAAWEARKAASRK